MEKVQFQLEGTLAELKDLHEKGLFTRAELAQITARRKKLETALVKRVAVREDYFAYARYEAGLEQLRRARYRRLGLDKTAHPRSVSTWSIVRRVLYILRRATDKFSWDVAVWVAYVEYARGEGMAKVVREALTTALQLHPREPALYLLLSQYYLDPSAPAPTSKRRKHHHAPTFAIENVSPARKTLLLGLRFMPDDRDLWREYIKLEIGWVEALRRRWKVLGIDVDLAGADEQMEQDVQSGLPPQNDEDEDDDEETGLGRHAFGASGESARKAIINGDLILTVLSSTFAHPVLSTDLTFHLSLIHLFRRYPTGLRLRLLDAVYEHLRTQSALRWDPVAQRTIIERALYDAPYEPEHESRPTPASGTEQDDTVVLSGETLVAELGNIVKLLRAKGSAAAEPDHPHDWEQQWNQEVGLWLLRWAGHEQVVDNEPLQAYLVASVNPLTKPSANPTEPLLIGHLDFLHSLETTSPARPSAEKIISLARSYTAMYPASVSLWLFRLRAETSSASDDSAVLVDVFLQAMTGVGASSERASEVWTMAMRWFDAHVSPPPPTTTTTVMGPHWRQAIKAARKYVGDVHTHGDLGEQLYASLLLAWAEHQLGPVNDTATAAVSVARLDRVVAQVCSNDLDAPFQLFPPLFQLISHHAPVDSAVQVAHILSTIHNLCLTKARNDVDRVDAVLAWASWAMTTGSKAGQVRPAWTTMENLKKEIQARQVKPGIAQLEGERMKQDALARLDVGWKSILAQVEEREHQSEDDVEMQ